MPGRPRGNRGQEGSEGPRSGPGRRSTLTGASTRKPSGYSVQQGHAVQVLRPTTQRQCAQVVTAPMTTSARPRVETFAARPPTPASAFVLFGAIQGTRMSPRLVTK